MAILKSQAAEVLAKLNAENKVSFISIDEANNFNNDLASELKEIKSNFEIRERNSRAVVSQIELSCLNS